jgi:uncharacterized protein (DUF1697 family)
VSTRIAFLRAVNVGKRTVKMARLVDIASELGYGDPWTYINSGNLVFDAPGSRAALEADLEGALEAAVGFEVTTFVRTAAELRRAVQARPFKVATGDTHFVTFLKSTPSVTDRRALAQLSNDFDTLVVQGRDVHWRMRGKSTDTKLKTKDWDDIVGHHRSTSRNINTLRTLVQKLDDRS